MRLSNTIVLGFMMLLAASYLDNVRGPLIPVLAEQFEISYGTTTWFLVLGNCGAIVALFALLPVMQIFSMTTIAKFLCILFFLLAAFLLTITNLTGLFIFAALLGALIPVFGALANLFLIQGTDEKERSKWMCALHMVYGSASLLSPLVVSALISRRHSWISPFMVYLPVMALTLFALVLNRKTRESNLIVEKQALGLDKSQWLSIGIFASYVAAEVMVSVWMISYLKEVSHLSLQESAPYLSGFFVVMTLSRGVCFFTLNEKLERKMLVGCLVLSAVALIFGFCGFLLGFVFAGVLGPFFPLFFSQCSQKFSGRSRSFTLWVLASNQIALGLMNIVLGKVSDQLGMELAYKIPVFLLGLSLILLGVYLLREKKSSVV